MKETIASCTKEIKKTKLKFNGKWPNNMVAIIRKADYGIGWSFENKKVKKGQIVTLADGHTKAKVLKVIR